MPILRSPAKRLIVPAIEAATAPTRSGLASPSMREARTIPSVLTATAAVMSAPPFAESRSRIAVICSSRVDMCLSFHLLILRELRGEGVWAGAHSQRAPAPHQGRLFCCYLPAL